jgi:hypothetical protein
MLNSVFPIVSSTEIITPCPVTCPTSNKLNDFISGLRAALFFRPQNLSLSKAQNCELLHCLAAENHRFSLTEQVLTATTGGV